MTQIVHNGIIDNDIIVNIVLTIILSKDSPYHLFIKLARKINKAEQDPKLIIITIAVGNVLFIVILDSFIFFFILDIFLVGFMIAEYMYPKIQENIVNIVGDTFAKR